MSHRLARRLARFLGCGIVVSIFVVFTRTEAQESLGPSEVSSIAFSPDGSLIAIASGPAGCSQENLEPFAIRIFDAQSSELMRSLVRHQCIVNTVAWSPDGSKLASSGEDGLAFIWDVNSAQAYSNADNVVRGQPRRGITWSSSGDMVADFILTGRKTMIWNVETGSIIAGIADPNRERISAIAWSPDGLWLAVVNTASQLQIWDVSNTFSTGQVDLVSSFENIPAITLAWSPNSDSLAYSTTSHLSILDIETGGTIQTFVGHTQPVLDIAWEPNGDSLVTGSLDETIRVWDVLTGLEIGRVQTSSLVGAVAWSPDGTDIAYGGAGDTIDVIPAPNVEQPTPTSTDTPLPTETPTPTLTSAPG